MRTELRDPTPSPEQPEHRFTIVALVYGPAPARRDPERRQAYDVLLAEVDTAAHGTPHDPAASDTAMGRERHAFQIRRLMWAHRLLAGDPRVQPTPDWDRWLDSGVQPCREACCQP